MAFFTTPDGVRLSYELEGSGPPLLLHIGAGCDADIWRAAGYVGPLSRSHTCILFDHRGHGKSDHPTSRAANHIDRYTDDVVALLGHLGYRRVSFFGWSNAITVGLKAADQHPGLFDALILFGAIGRRPTEDQLAGATQERLAALREKGWWYLLDDMIAAEQSPVPQWFIDRVVATDIEPYRAFSAARLDWDWSVWDALPRIDAPALFIAGELEDPEYVVREAAAHMPNAAYLRIPEREHINAFLASDLVLPPVMEFLAARRSGSVAAS